MMQKGQWGLVESDDPSFIWTPTPAIDPTAGKTDAELDADHSLWEGFDKFTEVAAQFEEELVARPSIGWKLYEAALKAGYDRAKHGRFAYWLFDFLAHWLKNNPIPTHQNRFNDERDVGDTINA